MLSSNPVESALTQVIREKFAALGALLNERTRRRWAAVEARALGRGGIARVAEATGLSRTTIGAGLRELAEGREDEDASGRLRNPGAGRKSLPVHDAGLVVALEKLVDPATRGDPMGPLRWTCSSAALLARELQAAGQQVSERSVNRLLHELGYSLQANRKTLEGRQHPDRDAQFNHINRQVRLFNGSASRWCRWTPRRRSSSAPSRTPVGSGVRAATRNGFGFTTSRTLPSARRFRTGSTI